MEATFKLCHWGAASFFFLGGCHVGVVSMTGDSYRGRLKSPCVAVRAALANNPVVDFSSEFLLLIPLCQWTGMQTATWGEAEGLCFSVKESIDECLTLSLPCLPCRHSENVQ